MLDGFLDPKVPSKRCPSNHAIANSLKFTKHLRLINSLNPVVWSRHWPFTQQLALGGRSIVTTPETTPTPILRPLHQIRSQSIAFNISTHGRIIFIRLNHKRLEIKINKVPDTSPFKVTQTRSYFPARSLAVDTWGLLGYLSRLGRGFFGPRRCFRNFDNFTLAAS